jgi:hypothetical protein
MRSGCPDQLPHSRRACNSDVIPVHDRAQIATFGAPPADLTKRIIAVQIGSRSVAVAVRNPPADRCPRTAASCPPGDDVGGVPVQTAAGMTGTLSPILRVLRVPAIEAAVLHE